VYDQTMKTLRHELNERGVVADVHVHAIRRADTAAAPYPTADTRTIVVEPGRYVDEVDRPVTGPEDQPPV
jgi:hypothetical protein